jgi:hypothetical protein
MFAQILYKKESHIKYILTRSYSHAKFNNRIGRFGASCQISFMSKSAPYFNDIVPLADIFNASPQQCCSISCVKFSQATSFRVRRPWGESAKDSLSCSSSSRCSTLNAWEKLTAHGKRRERSPQHTQAGEESSFHCVCCHRDKNRLPPHRYKTPYTLRI